MKFEWPFCAKCGHGVEKVERFQDVFSGDLIYRVTCHGERQVQAISGLDLHDAIMIWTTSAFDEGPTDKSPRVTYQRGN